MKSSITEPAAEDQLPADGQPLPGKQPHPGKGSGKQDGNLTLLRLLLKDRFAAVSALVLIIIGLTAVIGPVLMGDLATKQNLLFANKAPFSLAYGWEYVLGSDSLGRSMLARLVVASRTTFSVALPAVAAALVIGSLWGVWAGSVAIRSQAARTLAAMVVTTIATPGKIESHHAVCRYCLPCETMRPQLTSGGWIPMPRKLRDDSASMT